MKKTAIQLGLALSLSLALVACGNGGGGGTTPDNTPPTIVSMSPANGASGVAKDANIVITFSEKMDQASAQAAFQSADLGAAVITWNAAGTEMTVNPNTDMVYTAAGKSYSYSVTNTAKDAAGNALAAASNSTFTTYKQLTATLPMVASTRGEVSNAGTLLGVSSDLQVGDRSDNTSRRGFVGFDLSSLPAGLQAANILSAQARLYVNSIQGNPFTKLFESCSGPYCIFLGKSVVTEHVYYGTTPTASAYDATPISSDGRGLTDAAPCSFTICLFVGTVTGQNSVSVTEWVRDDWTNKASRGNLSEMRFSFPKATNADGVADYISINSDTASANKPTMVVTYLIP